MICRPLRPGGSGAHVTAPPSFSSATARKLFLVTGQANALFSGISAASRLRTAGLLRNLSTSTILLRFNSSHNSWRWKFLASARAPGQLRPFIQSATFFYSAIFATAVMVDSKVKASRRNQWDSAISDAKRDLEQYGENEADLNRGQNYVEAQQGPSPYQGASERRFPEKAHGLNISALKALIPALESATPQAVETSNRRRHTWFEACCRELAVEWRARQAPDRDQTGSEEHFLDPKRLLKSTVTTWKTDMNELISREEWPRFEQWAINQIMEWNQSLPDVYIEGQSTQSTPLPPGSDFDDFGENSPLLEGNFREAEPDQAAGAVPWTRLHLVARYQQFSSNRMVDSHLRSWLNRQKLPDYGLLLQEPATRFLAKRFLEPGQIVEKWQSRSFEGVSGPDIHEVFQARPQLGIPVVGKGRTAKRYPPQSIEATADLKARWGHRPKTRVKMEKIRLSAAKLISRLGRASGQFDEFAARVQNLPREARLRGYYPSGISIRSSIHLTKAIESEFIKVARNDGYTLRNASIPVPIPGYQLLNTSALNSEIYRLLCRFEHGQSDLVETLIGVSTVFLEAKSAPDVTSYNLLLSAFSEPVYYRIFNAFYWEFSRSRIRANEHTCALALYHFTARCDPVRFLRFASKVYGSSSGLMLANPLLKPNRKISGRFARHHSSRQRLIQRVTPHHRIFQYLLYGALRFLPDGDAFEFVSEQIRRGWTVSLDSLGLLIRAAAAEADWAAGLTAWRLAVMAAGGGDIILAPPAGDPGPDPVEPEAQPDRQYLDDLLPKTEDDAAGRPQVDEYGLPLSDRAAPHAGACLPADANAEAEVPDPAPDERGDGDGDGDGPPSSAAMARALADATIGPTPCPLPIPEDVFVAGLVLCRACGRAESYGHVAASARMAGHDPATTAAKAGWLFACIEPTVRARSEARARLAEAEAEAEARRAEEQEEQEEQEELERELRQELEEQKLYSELEDSSSQSSRLTQSSAGCGGLE